MIKFGQSLTLGFVLRFCLIFGLLIAPWPGWDQLYSRYFQAMAGMAFNPGTESNRIVVFAPSTGAVPQLDTRVTLKNAALADSTGRGLTLHTDLDSRSIGWLPTALTIALVLATPIPWPRRLGALAGGLVLVHLFIYVSLLSWVWNESTQLSLLPLSHFWQQVLDEMKYALIDQLGVSFTIPVVIWVLVTFRRRDALRA